MATPWETLAPTRRSTQGAGSATTIIRQTGTGPPVMTTRMNELFTIGLIYNFSGVTFVGGREGTAAGGGAVLGGAGIIGGELNNFDHDQCGHG